LEEAMTVERFPVEGSHILMFARAIGDDNPVYRDEQKARPGEAGGIIAPPTFVQAGAQFDPDYALRPRAGVPWLGSGKHPSGLPSADRSGGGRGSGGLHAEQHYEYHRHIKPGDVLTAKSEPGRTWEKESKRAGKLKFIERITTYTDQHGQVVITARSVGMSTERVIAKEE
jgi:acyl dehydratase